MRKLTHMQIATTSLEDVTEVMRRAGTISADVSVVVRTDGSAYWLAYIRNGMGPDEFIRTTSVIGETPRDVARYVHGFVTAVYATVGDPGRKPIG